MPYILAYEVGLPKFWVMAASSCPTNHRYQQLSWYQP